MFLVLRALSFVDEVVVAIGVNSQKISYFSLEQRVNAIATVFAQEPRVKAATYTGLTVDFAKEMGATIILRGLRTGADFEYERNIAQMNRDLVPQIETLFLLTEPALSHINSTIVREILRFGGDARPFVPKGVNLERIQ